MGTVFAIAITTQVWLFYYQTIYYYFPEIKEAFSSIFKIDIFSEPSFYCKLKAVCKIGKNNCENKGIGHSAEKMAFFYKKINLLLAVSIYWFLENV